MISINQFRITHNIVQKSVHQASELYPELKIEQIMYMLWPNLEQKRVGLNETSDYDYVEVGKEIVTNGVVEVLAHMCEGAEFHSAVRKPEATKSDDSKNEINFDWSKVKKHIIPLTYNMYTYNTYTYSYTYTYTSFVRIHTYSVYVFTFVRSYSDNIIRISSKIGPPSKIRPPL